MKNVVRNVYNVVDWLESHSEDEIFNSLSKSGKVHPDWQDRRQLYLVHLGNQLDAMISQGKDAEAQSIYDKYEKVRDALAKDYTTAGQTGQRGAVWGKISGEAVTWIISKAINKANESRLPETDIQKLMDSAEQINKASVEFAKGIVDEQTVKIPVSEKTGGFMSGLTGNAVAENGGKGSFWIGALLIALIAGIGAAGYFAGRYTAKN